jgi:hypothetical protein
MRQAHPFSICTPRLLIAGSTMRGERYGKRSLVTPYCFIMDWIHSLASLALSSSSSESEVRGGVVVKGLPFKLRGVALFSLKKRPLEMVRLHKPQALLPSDSPARQKEGKRWGICCRRCVPLPTAMRHPESFGSWRLGRGGQCEARFCLDEGGRTC